MLQSLFELSLLTHIHVKRLTHIYVSLLINTRPYICVNNYCPYHFTCGGKSPAVFCIANNVGLNLQFWPAKPSAAKFANYTGTVINHIRCLHILFGKAGEGP